jgi:transcriptional regulator with XRE-family HTH domain
VIAGPSPAVLVPPVRLGRLLAETREASGESIDELARRSGMLADPAFLDAIETGHAELDEPTVRWVTALYGVRAEQLVPQRTRLVIDLTEGTVGAGELRLRFEEPTGDQVLVNYLALVYAMRNVTVGTPVPMRKEDVVILGEALQQRPRDLEADLRRLMHGAVPHVDGRSRAFRRRLIVPLAGILVAATSVGGLLLLPGQGDHDRVSAVDTAPAPTQIGEAATLERGIPTTSVGGATNGRVDIGTPATLTR